MHVLGRSITVPLPAVLLDIQVVRERAALVRVVLVIPPINNKRTAIVNLTVAKLGKRVQLARAPAVLPVSTKVIINSLELRASIAMQEHTLEPKLPRVRIVQLVNTRVLLAKLIATGALSVSIKVVMDKLVAMVRACLSLLGFALLFSSLDLYDCIFK